MRCRMMKTQTILEAQLLLTVLVRRPATMMTLTPKVAAFPPLPFCAFSVAVILDFFINEIFLLVTLAFNELLFYFTPYMPLYHQRWDFRPLAPK